MFEYPLARDRPQREIHVERGIFRRVGTPDRHRAQAAGEPQIGSLRPEDGRLQVHVGKPEPVHATGHPGFEAHRSGLVQQREEHGREGSRHARQGAEQAGRIESAQFQAAVERNGIQRFHVGTERAGPQVDEDVPAVRKQRGFEFEVDGRVETHVARTQFDPADAEFGAVRPVLEVDRAVLDVEQRDQ